MNVSLAEFEANLGTIILTATLICVSILTIYVGQLCNAIYKN